MDARFRSGDEVRLRSQPDRAGKITANPVLLQSEYWYPIYFGPGQTGRHPESDLEPYTETTDPLQLLRDGRFAGREAFSKLMTQLKLATALRSHIYALQASRTTFYPYQFKPVLKFLESWKHRLLIADEVGLGKTIEAGLILTEFRARFDLDRVLIVPPSHLITKWQQEMKRRFDLDFEVLDKKRALQFLARFEEEGEASQLKGILSLQTLRGRGLQDRWEAVAPTFNLVIFDEAGRLRNPETLSNKAARLVGEAADGQLLITATPIQTSEADLFNLLALLDPDEFGNYDLYRMRLQTNAFVLTALRALQRGTTADLQSCASALEASKTTPYGVRLAENPMFRDVTQRLARLEKPSRRELIELQSDLNSLNLFGHHLNRTRKREVEEKRVLREASVVPCRPTEDEIEFYHRVTDICRSAYARMHDSTMAAFATMMPQRQVASCMVAMLEYTRERLGRTVEEGPLENSDLRPEDFAHSEKVGSRERINWNDLGSLDEWRSRLERNDSKWASLVSALKGLYKTEPGCKVILFSYFKKTLAYLQDRLNQIGIQSVVISGDVPTSSDDPDRDLRGRRLESFRSDPKIQILLSTEVGNEGLDLQFAHALINYDLPWNPMVVEQRIGRLDRIGQKSDKILIFNLTMPGTIEDLILERLYKRIKIFEYSIGDLEEILGEVIRELTQDLFSTNLTPEQQEERIRQAADVIEARKHQLDHLESRVADLIGHDEYFMEEIKRARASGRYLAGEELVVFIQDYLAAHHPSLFIERREQDGTYTMPVDDSLRFFVKQAIPADDLGLRLFLQRSARGTLRFIIDPEQAQEDVKLDFLSFHHPMIRAISDYYTKHQDELHPVSYLRLQSPDLEKGKYLWLLYLTEITGARPAKDLECVAARIDDGKILDEDESNAFIPLLMSSAGSVPPGERERVQVPEQIVHRVDDTAVERLNKRFQDRQRNNEALVSSWLATLDESFSRTLLVRQERLEVARSRNRKPHYIRMLEGAIRNLESDHSAKRARLEVGRRLDRSLALRGAGIVEVSNG
jgi:SNF2 family DNA or RNA helicase